MMVLPSKRRKDTEMVFKIETPQGVLPYEFATEREARDYVMAALSWSGTRYRIIKERKTA